MTLVALELVAFGVWLIWYSYQVPDSFAFAIVGITLFFAGLFFVGAALARWQERDG